VFPFLFGQEVRVAIDLEKNLTLNGLLKGGKKQGIETKKKRKKIPKPI